jgi:hypothetical protein
MAFSPCVKDWAAFWLPEWKTVTWIFETRERDKTISKARYQKAESMERNKIHNVHK